MVVKGQAGTGTVSDLSGDFALKVPDEKCLLVISYIGMQSKTVRVGKQRSLNIVLLEDRQQINEVSSWATASRRRPA